jgi:hypothetical protein
MKKLIAAVIASAFAFGAASTTFAADVPAKPVQQHVVKHKAHKAHKNVRKVHTVQKVKAPKMHAVKYHKKHNHRHARKTVR